MASTDDTIAVRISKELADRIISGAIEPGSRLRQDHVAEEFGTSHVPVREAFRRLEAQGLAISEPRRGVRVAAFDLSEVREVAEMRAALEVLALRHAAPHLTPAILDQGLRAGRFRASALCRRKMSALGVQKHADWLGLRVVGLRCRDGALAILLKIWIR